MASELATPEVVERFRTRFARDLERRPLELDPSEHRRRFAEALARCGSGTHYELLELEPDADESEIHAAYEELARLVHPSHAERIGLGGRGDVAEVVFERATEAYLVLGDARRRSAYQESLGLGSPPTPEGARAEETRKLARQLHARAQSLVEKEDFHSALEILRQAVRADPEAADCWALMGHCQARNPQWLHMASDSLRRALRLRPKSVELRLALAEVEFDRGNHAEARRLIERVLDLDPGNARASEALGTLGRLEGRRRRGFLSWLGR